jgi:hypothetical protein
VKDKEEKKDSKVFDSSKDEPGQDQFTDEELGKFSGGLDVTVAVCGICNKTIDKCRCSNLG